MKNVSILKKTFTDEDMAKVDTRILKAMQGWRIEAIHFNKVGNSDSVVKIPGTWGAKIYPYKYFQVVKKEGSVNPGEAENEIQMYLSCGWVGTDDEAVIVLTILGEDVLSGAENVGAEIYKFGSDKMKVYQGSKLITKFTEKIWFGLSKRQVNKVLIENVL